MKLLSILGTALAGAAIAMQSAGCTSQGRQGEKEWRDYSPLGAASGILPNIETVDEDSDGILSKEEVDKHVWEVIDEDKDGKLSIDEILKFRALVNKFYRATYNSDPIYRNWHETYWSLSTRYDDLSTQEISRIAAQVLHSEIERQKGHREFAKTTPAGWTQPLAGITKIIPGVDLFDYDYDQVLEGKEIDDFVRVVIDKDHNGKLSADEKLILKQIISALYDEYKSGSVRCTNLAETYRNLKDWDEAHTAPEVFLYAVPTPDEKIDFERSASEPQNN